MNRTLVLILGLIGVFLLTFMCYRMNRPIIEEDLRTRTISALNVEGFNWSRVEASEQTIMLTGLAPNSEARLRAGKIATDIYGVTSVENKMGLDEASSDGASRDIPSTSPPTLSVEGQKCQDRYDEALEGKSIRFKTASSEIADASFGLLDILSEIAKACPDFVVDVEGHTDSEGAADYNLRLSNRRANSVADALVERGVEKSILQALGYGEVRPIADNSSSAGKAQNRRIEFKVREN